MGGPDGPRGIDAWGVWADPHLDLRDAGGLVASSDAALALDRLDLEIGQTLVEDDQHGAAMPKLSRVVAGEALPLVPNEAHDGVDFRQRAVEALDLDPVVVEAGTVETLRHAPADLVGSPGRTLRRAIGGARGVSMRARGVDSELSVGGRRRQEADRPRHQSPCSEVLWHHLNRCGPGARHSGGRHQRLAGSGIGSAVESRLMPLSRNNTLSETSDGSKRSS